MDFKPMLAYTLEDPLFLTWPIMVSPKLDGLRCVIKGGQALSRNLKPFRNKYVQSQLVGLPDGLDGELIVGEPNRGNILGRTQSGIMAVDGEPDFRFYIFDTFDRPEEPFHIRHTMLLNIDHVRIKVVPYIVSPSMEHFLQYEQAIVDNGYEGVMLRDSYGKYKFGRSTKNERGLAKFKRFRDSEALVTGIEEGVSNTNEQTRSATGASKRSHHQDGMVPSGRAGTILATDEKTNQQLRISPGEMTVEDRIYYWQNPAEIIGHRITFKTFDYGALNVPRFSTFKAFYKVT